MLSLSSSIASNLTYTAVIIALAFIARMAAETIISSILKKFEDNNPNEESAIEQRAHTLANIFRNAISITIWTIAILTILSEWGIDILPILTGAGILGLAIGFGAQTLVKDVVTGFFLLMENVYNVGDTIKVAGLKGKVIRMDLRTTIMVGEDKIIYTVPNSQILTVEKFS